MILTKKNEIELADALLNRGLRFTKQGRV